MNDQRIPNSDPIFPYFVTYVKEDAASDLVEALKRDLSGNLMSFVE